MAVVERIEDAQGWSAVRYHCPACRERHTLRLRAPGAPEPTWTWDGNVEAPTLHPAVRTPGCHHQVRDGKLIYLSSTPSVLAGQAIEMEEVPGAVSERARGADH